MIRTDLFVENEGNIVNGLIQINDKNSLNIMRVLRLKPKDRIELFTKSNKRFVAVITHLSDRRMELKIEKKIDVDLSPLSISLIQGISQSKRMDFLIQKATELNAGIIAPFISDESKIQIRDMQSKMTRWERIIIESMRQCKRRDFPLLREPETLEDILRSEKTKENQVKIILDPFAKKFISPDIVAGKKNISVIVGSDVGFGENEVKIAENYGYLPVKISQNILRVETALIAVLIFIEINSNIFSLQRLDG